MKTTTAVLREIMIWTMLPVGALLFAIGFVVGTVILSFLTGAAAAFDFLKWAINTKL